MDLIERKFAMKKILLITLLVVFIPFFVVNLFVRTDEIRFHYATNKVIRVKDVSSDTILKVPFEEYIKGVLAGEMPVSFDLEALKAQAVAARSYALVQANKNKDNDANIMAIAGNMPLIRAKDIVDAYLKTSFSGLERHQRRIDMLNERG